MTTANYSNQNMFNALETVFEFPSFPSQADDQEFPTLGQQTATTDVKTTKNKKIRKTKDNTFTVNKTYGEEIAEKQEKEMQAYDDSMRQRRQESDRVVQPRQRRQAVQQEQKKVLELLSDPAAMAARLVCTKVCIHIARQTNGEYGVCYRETCSFAHSEQELQDPPCAYGTRCVPRRNNVCQFRHPNETREEYYARTGKTKPDVPATSEKTRRPRPYNKAPEAKPVETKVVDTKPVDTKPIESKPVAVFKPAPIPAVPAWKKPLNLNKVVVAQVADAPQVEAPQVIYTEQVEVVEAPQEQVVLRVPVEYLHKATELADTMTGRGKRVVIEIVH